MYCECTGRTTRESRVANKPKKPKFGGFSLNDYENHVAWCGGEPLPNWSGLKEPNPTTIQAGQKRPTYHSDETKAQKYRREGLKTKYSKDHATPLQWALQNIALNFSFGLANHFLCALNCLSNRSSVSANITDPQHVPNYSNHRAPHSPDLLAPAGSATRIIPAALSS